MSSSNQPASSPSFVFGPVPSRRLGRSLGIDLVPMKTCTYNCIYCQLGRTTHPTLERKPYIPEEPVIRQLETKLATLSSAPDFITFSGSGEPTLNSRIGDFIAEVNRLTTVPVAVLTNGSLLHHEAVREALQAADVVIPSLDAAHPSLFQLINRPHHSLSFSHVLQGLKKFRNEYAGEIWLEVMLCRGFNDDEQHVEKLRSEIEKIAPNRVHLNTVVRPPAEEFAFPLTREQMEKAVQILGGNAEILPPECPSPAAKVHGPIDREVLLLLQRRPCSLEDLSRAFGVPEKDMAAALRKLRDKGAVAYNVYNRTVFYKAGQKIGNNLSPGR
ncbi:MAG: radical SAM protein [Syntrophaceae bacterium]|nr:radical SAM protein [Syntrophaceae bacterium]